jgi:FtsH-binding integral membrane protein
MSSLSPAPNLNPGALIGQAGAGLGWHAVIQRTLGYFVLALGLLALVGWWFKITWLVVPGPNLIAMVPNTALCFTLLGAALIGPVGCRSRINTVLALSVGCIASVTLLQHLLDRDFGTDLWLVAVWLSDSNPYRGRMAPQTAVAFIGIALAMACLQPRMNRHLDAAAHALVILAAAIGMLGVGGYLLRVPLLYSWYQQTAMAVNSAVGFVLLSVALYAGWTARRRAAIVSGELIGVPKGTFASTFVISALVLTGLFGTVALAEQTERLLRNHVQAAALNKVKVFETEVAGAMETIDAIGNRVAVLEPLSILNSDADALTSRAFLQRIAESAVVRNTAAFILHGIDGRLVATAGELAKPAGFEVQLSPGVRLLWRDGFRLQRSLPLSLRGEPVGFVDIELRMPRLDQSLARADPFTSSGEAALCTPQGADALQCAPTRNRAQAFTTARFVDGKPLPMSFALDGLRGIVQSRDYRGIEVLAAHEPLPPYALGIVAKADVKELYAPVRQQFQKAQALLALLVLVFAWMLPTIQGATVRAAAPAPTGDGP